MKLIHGVIVGLALAGSVFAGSALAPALAQSSPSYRLKEHVLNAGGHPAGGGTMRSASYHVTLDSIGEALVGTGMSSVSYRAGAGFASAYPPPGETRRLWFSDHSTMHWDAEPSAGSYNVYRDLMSDLSGGGFGDCFAPGVTGTTTSDSGTPPAWDGWFYLVTVQNRLGEEGTKGWDSASIERQGNVCP